MSLPERRGTVAAGSRYNYSNHAANDTHQNVATDPTVEAVNAVSQLLRRASTADHTRRSLIRGKGRSDNMLSSKAKPTISTEEYEKLPPSIQRKYFSSEERFQIAQQSAAEKRQRQSSRKHETSTPSLKSPVSAEFSKRRRTIKKADTRGQRRSSLPLAFTDEAAKGEAAWFEALPEKVKRSQFDHQERTAFSRTEPLEPLERPHTSSSHKPLFDHFCWDKNRSASAETPRIPRSPCTTPSLHSPSPSVATSYSHESRTSTRAPHSQRHPLSSNPLSPTLTIPKSRTPEQERLASRRNFLLHPIPLPPPVLAPLASLASDSSDSVIVRLDDSLAEDITPTQEMETAQRMLKNLPPAWYDEKLDFGFERDDRKPSTSTCDSWEQPRTMSPSISDTASSHGPMTPITPATHGFDIKSDHSALPQIIDHSSNITNFSHLQAQRAEESKPRKAGPKHLVDGFYEGQDPAQPYSVTVRYDSHDPLALETLPVCDDMTGSHGAFAVHPESASGFRKVLKVIRGH